MQYCCYGSVLGLIILGTLSRYYYMRTTLLHVDVNRISNTC